MTNTHMVANVLFAADLFIYEYDLRISAGTWRDLACC